MQSLNKLKLEYEHDKKKIKQIDNKLHALEKRKRTESKYGHKQKNTKKLLKPNLQELLNIK